MPPRSNWWFAPRVPDHEWRAVWVEVILPDGRKTRAHWASDLSGEEQPPFEEWFEVVNGRSGYVQTPDPLFWRRL